MPLEASRQYTTAAVPERRGGAGKWLLVLLAFGAAFWLGRPLLQQKSTQAEAAVAASQPEVILYATDWCGYCKMSREFFAANGIRYIEHDIEKSSTALSEHKKLGGNGVPLIKVGDDVINGYNEGALRQLLGPWIRG
jgi:glutaredoxin